MRKFKFIGWFAYTVIISLIISLLNESGKWHKEFNGLTYEKWIKLLFLIIMATGAGIQIYSYIKNKKKSGEMKVKIKENESKIIGLYLVAFIDVIIMVEAVFSKVPLKEKSLDWCILVLLMIIATILTVFYYKIESVITDKGIYNGIFIPWKDINSFKYEGAILYITFMRKIMFIKYRDENSFVIHAHQREEVSKLVEENVGIK